MMMMMKKTVAAWTLAVIVATTFTARMTAQNRKGEVEPQYQSSIQVPRGLKKWELQKLARITREQAVQIAQGATTGTVVESALENEDQNLVYTVEVSNAGSTSEVIIDAGNGKVLAVQPDGDDESGDKDRDGDNDKDNDSDSD
jgi:uncharacterized membrane protein YkoI